MRRTQRPACLQTSRDAGREQLRHLFYYRSRQMLAAQESVGLPFQSRMRKVARLLSLRTQFACTVFQTQLSCAGRIGRSLTRIPFSDWLRYSRDRCIRPYHPHLRHIENRDCGSFRLRKKIRAQSPSSFLTNAFVVAYSTSVLWRLPLCTNPKCSVCAICLCE